MAMASSVRRRGEPSGHRSLRITVAEQLVGRGVDIDAIKWDSYRLDDGRWAVTADYRSGDTSRHASFFYDLRGRFSVAANDEARWLLGDQPTSRGSQRGRPRPMEESSEGDTEPTLVSDKLALAKAAHEAARHRPAGDEPGEDKDDEPSVAVSRKLRPVADVPSDTGDEAADVSPIGTRYGMLGGDGYSEDSPRVYPGLSDATAVPETDAVTDGGWEPAIVINYPVEPSMHDEALIDSPESEEHSVRPFGATAEHELPGTDEPGPPDLPANLADRTDEAHEFEIESLVDVDTPPERKSVKRKRASVPSWDEIMFGGPKRQS
jgi:hypothetical protein